MDIMIYITVIICLYELCALNESPLFKLFKTYLYTTYNSVRNTYIEYILPCPTILHYWRSSANAYIKVTQICVFEYSIRKRCCWLPTTILHFIYDLSTSFIIQIKFRNKAKNKHFKYIFFFFNLVNVMHVSLQRVFWNNKTIPTHIILD